MMSEWNGLGGNLSNLSRLSNAQSRSISAENFSGEKGQGGRATTGTGLAASGNLGVGWKISPSIVVAAGETREIALINGPGVLQHWWMTVAQPWRDCIVRVYWDDAETPSVECPIGDFFACGWGEYAPLSSAPVCVNPGSAFNCYWPMPFRKHCRVTLENRGAEQIVVYYQIDYTLTAVPDDEAYFYAQFRRVNPLSYKDVVTIVDGVSGRGHYVGTYLAWGVNNSGWWGEGEIKFYLDGDEFPTICGTGTEDYFGGSYNFENQRTQQYETYTTPYCGLSQVLRPDGLYRSQTRFGMYRWHVLDPIRFEQNLRVTIQALGWRSGGKYLPLQDDISSVAFWYQNAPHAPFPTLPDREFLEII